MRLGLLAAWAAVSAAASLASELPLGSAFTSVPDRFAAEELTLSSRGLGLICLARKELPDGSVCNPTALDSVTHPRLVARAFLGNGFTNLDRANRLINQPITRDVLQGLFTEESTTGIEANLGLSYAMPHLGATFTPYRIQFVSEIHNPGLPVVKLAAAMEREVSVMTGVGLGRLTQTLEGFKVGAKARFLHRRVLSSEFGLIELSTQDPGTLVPVLEGAAVFFEPVVSWEGRLGRVHLLASAQIKNLGGAWGASGVFTAPTDGEFGFGLGVPLPLGELRIGAEAVRIFTALSLAERFRLGASYKLGVLEVLGGANAAAVTGGLHLALGWVQAGIVYEAYRAAWERTDLVSRLSTEISFRVE